MPRTDGPSAIVVGDVASITIAPGIWLITARWPSTCGIEGLENSDTDIVAVFDNRVVLRSGPFGDGSVTAVFEAVRLDLRRASLDPPGARLQVTTIFGDIDIHPVPVATAAM